MRVRKLDANGDMSFGRSQSDFYRDDPVGVAQCAKTRLGLWQGEWFANTAEGTPWKTKVLGKYTAPIRDQVIRARVLGTPGATEISAYASQFDPEARQFSVQITMMTLYGTATVKGPL